VIELDRILRDAIQPGTLLVISGHPGSGKTTLASTICYANALQGRKCLYISFQESKEKLYVNMARLGLNLEEIEKKGLLNHLKLPLVVKPESTSEILEIISKEVAKVSPQVVVVDSITPLLKAVEKDLEARAILQNFFAELPRLINGLVVLIAEIPSGREAVDLGDLEFVADVIVSLKHRVESGLLSRYVEIVKARGASLSVVELPFSIVEGRGIVVLEPIVIEEIPAMGAESIALPCSVLNDLIGPVRRGGVIYITYPPDARPVLILVYILAMALKNDARVLFISYKVSPEDIKMSTESWLVKLGVDRESARELLNKYFIVKSINPTSVSLPQLSLLELKIVDEHRPDIVVFHGVDIPAALERDVHSWMSGLLNQLLYLKKKGLVVIRMGSLDDKFNYNASLADIVVKFTTREVEVSGKKHVEYEVYVWRRGAAKPGILKEELLEKCLEEGSRIFHENLTSRA